MSSLPRRRGIYSISRKSTDFGHFWLPKSTFKVDFLNVQARTQKILVQFPGKGCKKHCVHFYVFDLQKGAEGDASRFAKRRFPKSAVLARCSFVRR